MALTGKNGPLFIHNGSQTTKDSIVLSLTTPLLIRYLRQLTKSFILEKRTT